MRLGRRLAVLAAALLVGCGPADSAPAPEASNGDGAAGDTLEVVMTGAAEVVAADTLRAAMDSVEGLAAGAPPASQDSDLELAPRPTSGAPCDTAERPCFQRPDSLRGIYLNAWAAGSSRRVDALVDLAKRTEVNAFVIDIKDATGFVSHRSELPEVQAIGADGETRIRDLPGLLRRLEAEGIYPIARIVIVKDPLLIAARPELAVQDTAGGVWMDSKEIIWLNLYNEGVWEYHVELAKEVAAMGFPEIQWDYVRFPDAPASDLARALFPGDSIGPRTEAVRSFLGYARDEFGEAGLDVRTTADVFGVTTNVRRDVGIGQVWETFIDRVDAALPMVYPSHYWEGSFGFDEPNAHPYEVVYEAVEYALRRSAEVEGAGATIPWLQDFTLGPPRYEAPEVRAQIEATYDAGAKDWILWNPGSSYTEAALQPTAGWKEPPLIRIGSRIVPVDRRFETLEFVADSVVRARAPSAGPAAQDTLPARD